MRLSLLLAGVACLSSPFMAGCGGSSSSSNSIAGTVAVGMPMTNATLRVVDATGAAVATGVVVAADGRYPAVPLTGTAPYRLEACGNDGASYICLYSVANGPGRANVTPLTNAIVLLSTGALPGAVMDGAVTGLDPASVHETQAALQLALAAILDNAGLPPDFDFVTGNLVAGSGRRYDFVLDSLDVTTGAGAEPFVQITPRLGTGNVYLEPGTPPVGELVVPPAASDVSLAGIGTLFENITAAVASAEACAHPVTGLRPLIADDARMSTGGEPLVGGDAVAEGICSLFANSEQGGPPFGSALTSPTLGRCDLSGAAPRCRVSFTLLAPTGEIIAFVENIGVTALNGAWKFLGELDVVPIHAATRALRSHRADDATAPNSYARAIGFDIPVVAGLACARVEQPTEAGPEEAIALFKRHSPESGRLSLWTVDDQSSVPSLDPAAGVTRNNEDPWLALPEGAEWDDLIRNFYLGGRTVTVTLFSDEACSTPLAVEEQSEFIVDVPGLPPLWEAMGNLPWPALTPAALTELADLTIAAFTNGSYTAGWSYPQGPSAIQQGTFCLNGDCTTGNGYWLGQAQSISGATSLLIPLSVGDVPVDTSTYKLLALTGRTPEGLMFQSNEMYCPLAQAGSSC